MISLEEITKVFPGMEQPAVGGLSLEIDEGEFVVLVGPSGCGKTTTLKMINRIIEPTSGEIWVNGVAATDTPGHELRRSIGYVIQQIGLFPHRTIAENIATVPHLLGWDEESINTRIEDLVTRVGLTTDMLTRYPAALSGGQQQRVGVARALAADPPVLLMDEPFGAVDPIVRAQLQEEFLRLQEELTKTVVFVTHDIDEALRMGDRIAILNVGGVLEQFDTPENILSEPANEFIEDFVGGERGLKRLALRSMRSVDLARGPVVDVTADTGAARAVMSEYGTDWVALLKGDRLLGWVWGTDVEETPLDALEPHEFWVELNPDSTLRSALDAVVMTRSRVAVVIDDGVYQGMLGLETIAGEVEL